MIAYLILAVAQDASASTVPPPPQVVLPPHSIPPAAIQGTGALTGPRERMPAQRYLSPDDYPVAALGTPRVQGAVRFTLTIDPSGRVAGCTITHSSGSAVLDAETCRIMHRRARYVPAADSSGQPVSGTIEQEIVWKLPAR